MTDRNERRVVVVGVVLVLSFVLLGILAFRSERCPGPTPGPPLQISPAHPIVIPQGTEFSVCVQSFIFSVTAPVDLHGSWVASSPVSLAVFNLSYTGPYLSWPNPGSAHVNGTLNVTLFPGTYAIEILGGTVQGPEPVWTAIQPITAEFDRGLVVVQQPTTTNISAGNYAAWQLTWPPGGSSVHLALGIATNACNFEAAILPPSIFHDFQSNRDAINSPGAVTLFGWAGSSCSATPTSIGLGPIGPLNISSGDTLVLFNAQESTAQLVVLDPIELSYLTPT